MKKNELICVEICYEAKDEYDVSRQTVFISKESFSKNKYSVRLRKAKIKKIMVSLTSLKRKRK